MSRVQPDVEYWVESLQRMLRYKTARALGRSVLSAHGNSHPNPRKPKHSMFHYDRSAALDCAFPRPGVSQPKHQCFTMIARQQSGLLWLAPPCTSRPAEMFHLFLFDARQHLNAGSARPRVNRPRDSSRPRVRRARHTLRVNCSGAGYNIGEGGNDICQM